MGKLNTNINFYVGSQIEYEAELNAIAEIVNTVEVAGISAVIIANVNLSGRQIDIILATERQVLVIEIKNHFRSLRGGVNGKWKFRSAAGEWKNTRNYYQQTLDASHALKDSMSGFSKTEVNYPTAALVFVPSIPNGSSIPPSDYKVEIGSLELIRNLANIKQNSTWSLQEWRRFSYSLNLTQVFSLETARSSKLMNATEALRRYEIEFLKTYNIGSKKIVHFDCYVNKKEMYSKEIIESGSSGKDLLIIGPSGCAKSMLAMAIGIQSFDKGQIPIIIEAKYFNNDFGILLNQEVCLLDMSSFGQLISACRALNKRLTIILDGFNECPHAFRHRLYRCIKATSVRHRTGIILTSQKVYKEFNNLNCETIKIEQPNIEVKNAIANIDSNRKNSSDITKLIELAKSGFEADIIGQIKSLITANSSRFDIFEKYTRKILGEKAQVGINCLSQVAKHLTESLTFSMSVRDLERFQAECNWPSDIFDFLKSKNILTQRGDSVSFEHELFLDIFATEAIVRACSTRVDEVIREIVKSTNYNRKVLIVGCLHNTALLEKVLDRLEDKDVLLSCILGECGEYARMWVENRYKVLFGHFTNEVNSVIFSTDDKFMWGVGPCPDSLLSYSKQEEALSSIVSQLLWEGMYLDEIFDLVGLMEQRIQSESRKIVKGDSKQNRSIRDSLYSVALDDQNSSIALSKIIAWIGVNSFSSRSNEIIIQQWIESKLAGDFVSDGQLIMLLKLARAMKEINPFESILAKLIIERFEKAPSCLAFSILDTVRGMRFTIDNNRTEIIDALNDIKTLNIWTSTFLIDALKSIGGIESFGYEETVKAELEQVFKDPDNPESWSLARSIYTSQFDHAYDDVYCEVINSLPDNQKKNLLCLAVRSRDEYNMFASSIISELAIYKDVNTCEHIAHWANSYPGNLSFPQDSVSAFIITHIILGNFEYGLEPKNYDDCEVENAMHACGELYYYSSRDDLDKIEKEESCNRALNVLLENAEGISLSIIKECEDSLSFLNIDRMLKEKFTIYSIVDSFPQEISSICRLAILNREKQCGRRHGFDRSNIVNYAINILGRKGLVTDLSLIREVANEKECGSSAMLAIQEIESRFKN